MILPGHIGKFLGTIFPSQNLISHRLLIVSPERCPDFPEPERRRSRNRSN